MKKKNYKILFLALVLFAGILCPCSIIRTNSGLALEKNNIFAQDPDNSSQTAETAENADKEKNEDGAADGTVKKNSGKDAEGEKKEEPRLYDYSKQNVEETSTAWLYFKFFLVIGLLLAGFYLFFRFVTKKAGITNLGVDAVNVLTAVPLGPNKYIQIVDIAGQIFVLGVTDSNISMITEITDKDSKDRIKLISSKSSPVKNASFQKYFNDSVGFISSLISKAQDGKLSGRMKNSQQYRKDNMQDEEYPDEYIDTDRMEYLKRQKDRLKKLNGFSDED